ncbi:GNAT family N-acetyltransferase [Microlunatus elymi]|uniref:GNAT family N-acetyltransferase n=1 Tax=Microlunatus elymi TaxID=2596828 RepID=A0A516Q367_9ACTN|nr:GNAT family N-acetyltransferase [Microlunatus elymi]QDP97866.1 GNAT family N-acetyltransferase [Microlunatus elymi]
MTDVASPTHTPPHRSELTLSPLTEQDFENYFTVVARGFHSELHADDLEIQRAMTDVDRCFGFCSGDRWVSTTLSFAQRMAVPGGSVPTAAVTDVTVTPGHRRRGLLTQMMRHQLTGLRERGEEPVALLWASESSIYGRFGYGQVTRRFNLSGQTRELGFLREVDLGDGSADEVTADAYLAAAAPLRETIFTDRPGHLHRSDAWWRRNQHDPERNRHGAGPLRFVLHFAADGTPDGFANFRIKEDSSITDLGGEVIIGDLDAADPQAYAALWRWLLDLDLIRAFRRHVAPTDEPLLQLAANPRMIKTELGDATYARIVDVPTALQARTYAQEVDLVLEIEDSFLPEAGGRFRLAGGPDGADVSRTDHTPDLSLTARQLAMIYLGGTPVRDLAVAGQVVEHTAGAVQRVSAAFAGPRAPFCRDFF